MGIKSTYKSTIDVAGVEKTVVVVNFKHDNEETTKTVDSLHHIHVVDRSGSMYGEIDGLIENVKQTFDHMSDNDYVSLVWFSGSGQHGTVIRGARKDDSIKVVADTIKSVLSTTCFSEVISNDVTSIIDDLAVICPNFSVTFFTDGHTVTNWSSTHEHERTLDAIKAISDKIIAFNTIGYGYNYNSVLLNEMSNASQFGKSIHSSKIDEYKDIFSHNYTTLSNLVGEKLEIASNASHILYLTSKSTKLLSPDGDIIDYTFNHLDKTKNQFVFIFDVTKEEQIYFGDEVVLVDKIKTKIPSPTLRNALYALAYEFYKNGKRDVSVDILAKNIGDKALVDEQLSAFTYDEIARYSKKLNTAVFKTKERYSNGDCPQDYLPSDNALCVMDILKLLVNGDASYVPSKDYNRIGLKTNDNFNLFEKLDTPDNGVTPVSNITTHKSKLNVSLLFKILGKVSLNPKQATKVGLDPEVNSHIYRTHTLIKDGVLNIEKPSFIVDTDTLNALTFLLEDSGYTNALGFIHLEQGKFKVSIDLSQLPVINRLYAKMSIDDVLDYVVKNNRLEAEQKVLNYIIKEAKSKFNNVVSYGQFNQFSTEQIEVLQEHGLNKDLSYKGVDVKVEDKNDKDFYETKVMTFALKGFSSLPSVGTVLNEAAEGKNLTKPKQFIFDTYNEIKENLQHNISIDIENVKQDEIAILENNILKSVKNQLTKNRITLSSIKIAKVLTGSWFEGLEVNKKEEETYTSGDNTIIVKRGLETVYFG